MTVKAFLLPVQGNPRLSSAILLWVANQIPLPSDSGVTRKASIGSEVEVWGGVMVITVIQAEVYPQEIGNVQVWK